MSTTNVLLVVVSQHSQFPPPSQIPLRHVAPHLDGRGKEESMDVMTLITTTLMWGAHVCVHGFFQGVDSIASFRNS